MSRIENTSKMCAAQLEKTYECLGCKEPIKLARRRFARPDSRPADLHKNIDYSGPAFEARGAKLKEIDTLH